MFWTEGYSEFIFNTKSNSSMTCIDNQTSDLGVRVCVYVKDPYWYGNIDFLSSLSQQWSTFASSLSSLYCNPCYISLKDTKLDKCSIHDLIYSLILDAWK